MKLNKQPSESSGVLNRLSFGISLVLALLLIAFAAFIVSTSVFDGASSDSAVVVQPVASPDGSRNEIKETSVRTERQFPIIESSTQPPSQPPSKAVIAPITASPVAPLTKSPVTPSDETQVKVPVVARTPAEEARTRYMPIVKYHKNGTVEIVWQNVMYTQQQIDYENKVLKLLRDSADGPDKMTMVALVNHGMREMTMNFLESLRLQKYKKFVILGFDQGIIDFLCKEGYCEHAALVPQHWVHKSISAQEELYKRARYNDLLHAKILIILAMLQNKINIFFLDVDLVFLHPYVLEYINLENAATNPDFVYMVDTFEPNNKGTYDGDVANGGFWQARPTQMMKDLLTDTLAMTMSNPRGLWSIDQECLNYLLDKRGLKYSRAVRPLSKSLFMNGYFFTKLGILEKYKIPPMVVHMNWMMAAYRKKDQFVQNGWWFIGEKYADTKGPTSPLVTAVPTVTAS